MLELDPREFLLGLFTSALNAVDARHCLPSALAKVKPPYGHGRTVVIGAGKAAAAMAREVEKHWSGPLTGLVVTRYGHGLPCQQIEVVEAAHPVPDQAGRAAAARMLQLVGGLSADDLVLCLISGGGSALLTLPAAGITLEQKQQINRALLKSGATIGEINCVRKHLSAIKGGRLAQACVPARVVTLLISDVAGDDASVIASGPTLPDASTSGAALAVLARYQIELPATVRAHLMSAASETPKPGAACFNGHSHAIIATAQQALEAAATRARAAGVTPYILSDRIEGEARDIGLMHAALALQIAQGTTAIQHDLTRPCVLLSGGETTVTVRGQGRGGRNAEFLLSTALALNGATGIYGLACDTDGIDGSEDNAGGFCAPDSLARALALGLDARALLDDNNGYGFFSALGDLIVTGPTRTNVNDFRALLIV